jgi:NADH:ubiquinone oxidoreductase subunit F (NADH-binding)
MASALSPQIRILAAGERRVLTDVGHLDAERLDAYRDTGGYAGLTRAVTRMSPEEVIAEVERAGLRGRGGSGFPTAAKWRIARAAPGERRIAVANLMGADPSALGDRALAEGNPHLVIEGLLIAAYAIGASEAIVAVRRDWVEAIARLRTAAAEASDAHLAGYLVLGTDTSVQLGVWEGSGAYVAGEETALLSALGGDRGMPLIRPPYPATSGLAGAPTLVQNAETLAHVAWILLHSSEAFASVGPAESRGTKVVTMMGRIGEPGVLEAPLGTSIGDLVAMAGGPLGTAKATFVGGPAGGAIPASAFGTPYDYGSLAGAGAIVGSGSVLVVDSGTCMVDAARFFVDFSAREACGKAVPCRIGTRRLVEALDRILAASPRPNDITMLRELSAKMSDTALCRLEQLAPGPILTTLDHFADEYRAHAERGECLAGSCSTATSLPPLLQPLAGLE